MYEGHKAGIQAELLKRNRPTHSYGISDIVKHFGLGGLFYVLGALASTSAMIYWINVLFLTGVTSNLLSCALYLMGALYFWGKTLERVSSVHEASEALLDQDVALAVQGQPLPEREVD